MLLIVTGVYVLAANPWNDSLEGVGYLLMMLGLPWTLLLDSLAYQTAMRYWPIDVFAYGLVVAATLNGALLGGTIGAIIGRSKRGARRSEDHEDEG